MNNEKFKELWENDELEEVFEELDGSYRHGNYVYTVFRYGNDFWAANYTVSGDGEWHGIREDDFDLTKVYPVTVVTKTTEYVTTPQRPPSPTRYIRKFHEIEAIQFPVMETDITNVEAMESWLAKMEVFQDWVAINAADRDIKLNGDKLVIRSFNLETTYPGGVWLVKEPGRDVYPLLPDKFEALYEKA